jgi:hypothetical protein
MDLSFKSPAMALTLAAFGLTGCSTFEEASPTENTIIGGLVTAGVAAAYGASSDVIAGAAVIGGLGTNLLARSNTTGCRGPFSVATPQAGTAGAWYFDRAIQANIFCPAKSIANAQTRALITQGIQSGVLVPVTFQNVGTQHRRQTSQRRDIRNGPVRF